MKERVPQALVVAICQASKVLGLSCVAKRVDTPAVREWLAAVGIDYAQGFLLDQPRALTALTPGNGRQVIRRAESPAPRRLSGASSSRTFEGWPASIRCDKPQFALLDAAHRRLAGLCADAVLGTSSTRKSAMPLPDGRRDGRGERLSPEPRAALHLSAPLDPSPRVIIVGVLLCCYLFALLWRVVINGSWMVLTERHGNPQHPRDLRGHDVIRCICSCPGRRSTSASNTTSRYRSSAKRRLRAGALAQEAQLKMLRYQLNPHFLFNTLNAISTLILDNQNRTANQTVMRLSEFLRYTLDQDPMKKVTLRQEIEAMNLYLTTEKLRFGDRLQLEYAVEDAALDALVPSLLLQPLIENAVKYAVSPSEKGGAIRIEGPRAREIAVEVGAQARARRRPSLPRWASEESGRFHPHVALELFALRAQVMATPDGRAAGPGAAPVPVVAPGEADAERTEAPPRRTGEADRPRVSLPLLRRARRGAGRRPGRAGPGDPRIGRPPAEVRLGDACEYPDVPARSVDLVLSSPPYAGVYDYAEHHAVRFRWLGLPIEELRSRQLGERRRRTGRRACRLAGGPATLADGDGSGAAPVRPGGAGGGRRGGGRQARRRRPGRRPDRRGGGPSARGVAPRRPVPPATPPCAASSARRRGSEHILLLRRGA